MFLTENPTFCTEITGRWKILQYYARNFFAPILISPYDIGNGDIGVYLISDQTVGFEGQLQVRLFSLDDTSMSPLWDVKYDVTVVSSKHKHIADFAY